MKKSALEGAVRSGVGARDGDGDCGSCDGGCVPAGGGVHPGRVPGCDDGGRGAGTRVEELAGAGAGASACDGGRLAPAAMTSSPSCGPWSSCCRWRWHLGGVKVQPSASGKTKWTPNLIFNIIFCDFFFLYMFSSISVLIINSYRAGAD